MHEVRRRSVIGSHQRGGLRDALGSVQSLRVLVVVRESVDGPLLDLFRRVLDEGDSGLRVVAVTRTPGEQKDFHLYGQEVVLLCPPPKLEWTKADALRVAVREVERIERSNGDVVVAVAPERLGRLPDLEVMRNPDGLGGSTIESNGWQITRLPELVSDIQERTDHHLLWRPYLSSLGKPALLSTLMVVLSVAIELALPWPLKILVDELSGSVEAPAWVVAPAGDGPLAIALVLAVISLVLVLADALTAYGSTMIAGSATERVAGDMRVSVFTRITHLPLGFFDRHPSGELLTRLERDVDRVQGTTVRVLTTLFADSLRLVGILVILLFLDPVLALVGLVSLPVLAIVVAARRKRTKAVQRQSRALQGELTTTANELLRNVRLFKAFGAENEAVDRYRTATEDAVEAEIVSLRNSALYSPVADLALGVISGVVMIIGVQSVVDDRLTLGSLLVVFTYLSSLYGPSRSLAGLGQLMSRTAASRERLADVYDEALPDERVEPVPPFWSRRGVEPTASGELLLSNVDFSYRPSMPVLEGVDLCIPPGTHACIIGPSGIGKTTILHLILRLHEVTGGQIEIDGVDIRDLPMRTLRNRIALVPQDSWIIDASLRENLLVGAPDAAEGTLAEAISLANLDPLVESLPDGLSTALGESGVRVSGGERKRVALARALVRRPGLLLLDEPTSGLDSQNEAQVIAAIRGIKSPRSVLTVTHSPRVAAVADVVYELRDNQLFVQSTDPAVEHDTDLSSRPVKGGENHGQSFAFTQAPH